MRFKGHVKAMSCADGPDLCLRKRVTEEKGQRRLRLDMSRDNPPEMIFPSPLWRCINDVQICSTISTHGVMRVDLMPGIKTRIASSAMRHKETIGAHSRRRKTKENN